MQLAGRWETVFMAALLLAGSVLAPLAHAHSRAADEIATRIKTVDADMQAERNSKLSSYIVRNFKISEGKAAAIVAAAQRYAEKFDLHPELILAVIAVESTFRERAVSSGGARGLMQIMPSAHPKKIRAIGGAQALFDPSKNIHTGSTILAEYLQRGDGDLSHALLRYNGSLRDPKARYARKVMRTYGKMRRVTEKAVASLH